MLARVARDVFWMSRYVERGLAVARLIDVTLNLELDNGDATENADLWAPLLGPAIAGGYLSAGSAIDPLIPTARSVRDHLAFDTDNADSLISCVRRARTAARGIRECLSSEMWEQLNTLFLSLVDPQLYAQAEEAPHAFFRRVRDEALFFFGMAEATMARDETWFFLSLGKFLERADSVARVIYLQSHLLTTSVTGSDPTVRWLAVLRSCGCAEAYARFYSLRVDPARVVEFLLLNPLFPQSVRFSTGGAWDALSVIAAGRFDGGRPGAISQGPDLRALGQLRARLEHAAVDEVLEEGLDGFLADVHRRIALVSDHVTRMYLSDEPASSQPVAVARAASIMAAQQQQQ